MFCEMLLISEIEYDECANIYTMECANIYTYACTSNQNYTCVFHNFR